MTESRAELYAFLVEEAKTDSWRLPLPARELMQITTDADLKALNRIAEDQVSIVMGDGPGEGH